MNNEDIKKALQETADAAIAETRNEFSYLRMSSMTINQFCELVNAGSFSLAPGDRFDLDKAKLFIYSVITCGTDYMYEVRGYSDEYGHVTFTNGTELMFIVGLLKEDASLPPEESIFSPLMRRRILQFHVRTSTVDSFKRTPEKVIDIATKLGIIK